MKDIIIGSTHTSTLLVAESDTALALGSGDLQVLGTPAMIALMENAAMLAINPFLESEPKQSCVGVSLNVSHFKLVTVGETVTATAVVTAVDGRRIDFDISASDPNGQTIGQGTHMRFVVDVEKFMSKIGK